MEHVSPGTAFIFIVIGFFLGVGACFVATYLDGDLDKKDDDNE